MPISREMAWRYPKDWRLRRRFIIQYRAAGRCEWCGAVNYSAHPDTGSKVVLTIAHVWDKAPENASLLNLAALCQRCHNRWDAADRAWNRMRRQLARVLRAGQLPLPFPEAVSIAMELYQLLVKAGQLTPPAESDYQLSIPRSAYEYIGMEGE